MKKRFLTGILISALILSFSAFLPGLMREKVTADVPQQPGGPEEPISPDDIEMLGASIRSVAPMGIRFEARINKAAVESAAEVGMYLCPTDLLTDGEFPRETMESHLIEDGQQASGARYIKRAVINKGLIRPDPDYPDTKVRLKLSLVGIMSGNLDRQFSAMVFIKTDNVHDEVWSVPRERSIAYVAREAEADLKSGLTDKGKTFVNKIIADSNELSLIKGAVDTAEGNRRSGKFSRRIDLPLSGTDEVKLRINCSQMEEAQKCSLEMYAKAAGTDVKINGQNVSSAAFTRLHFDDLPVEGKEVTLPFTGSGNLWIDDIKYTKISNEAGTAADIGGEGVTRLKVDCLKLSEGDGTAMEKDENGHMVYTGDATVGYEGNKFCVESETGLEGNLYLALRFKISANTYVGKIREKGDLYDEGLWMHAWSDKGQDKGYMQIFDGEGNDLTVYFKQHNEGNINLSEGVDFGYVFGSLNRPGYRLKKDGWYYAVTTKANVSGNSYSFFYRPFDITFGEVYTLTGAAKDSLFNCNVRPVPVPELKIANERTINVDQSAGVNPQTYGTEEITYTSDDPSVATVDGDGIIHGLRVGTCKVTAKAGGLKSECAVKVKEREAPPALATGNGVTEIGLDNITYDPADFTDKIDLRTDDDGYMVYMSKSGTGMDATVYKGGFKINNDDAAIKAADYLVFVLKYSAETDTNSDTVYPGVWFVDWQEDTPGFHYGYTCLDRDLKDCSGDKAFPAKGTMPEDRTDAETWYYLISPTAGHHVNDQKWANLYGSLYGDFEFTIAHVYAVTEDVRAALLGGTAPS